MPEIQANWGRNIATALIALVTLFLLYALGLPSSVSLAMGFLVGMLYVLDGWLYERRELKKLWPTK